MNSAEAIINSTAGKWFTVKFIKKDGTLRVMNCRLGVKKHLRGGVNNNPHLGKTQCVVYDRNSSYRTVTFDKVKEVIFGGEHYNFGD